jgi:hypothetical protein
MQNGTVLVVILGLLVLGVLLFILLEVLWPRKRGRRRPAAAGPPRAPRPEAAGSRPSPVLPRRIGPAAPPLPVATRPAVSWSDLEAVVQEHARKHEFAEARRILAEALDAADLPVELREVVRRLRTDVVGAEVGQLTATALREAQRGSPEDTLRVLEQAEAAWRAAGEALADERRDEATRRLWLTCTRLAGRRLGTTDAAGALPWLFRSLAYVGDEADRLTESTTSIVRALETLVEQCSGAARRALAAGRPEAARAEAERCDASIRKAAEAGVPEDLLEGVAAKARELLEGSSA